MDLYDLTKEELVALAIQLQEQQKLRLWNACKGNAKKTGMEFSITVDDIDMPTHCPFLGIKLTNILGQGRTFSNASLDRIDPRKGYVIGNVQIVSDLANRMKQDATPEQLLKFAEGVMKIYGGK